MSFGLLEVYIFVQSSYRYKSRRSTCNRALLDSVLIYVLSFLTLNGQKSRVLFYGGLRRPVYMSFPHEDASIYSYSKTLNFVNKRYIRGIRILERVRRNIAQKKGGHCARGVLMGNKIIIPYKNVCLFF